MDSVQPDLSKAEMPGPGLLRGFRAGREPSVPKPTSTSSRYSLRFKDADFSSSIPRYQRQEGGERGVTVLTSPDATWGAFLRSPALSHVSPLFPVL